MRTRLTPSLAGLLGLLAACQGADTAPQQANSTKPASKQALPQEPVVYVGIIGGIT